MELYNLWISLDYEKKRIFKMLLNILIIFISYILIPLIYISLSTNFGYPQLIREKKKFSLTLIIFFALILIGIIIGIYFIKPYSIKKIPLVFISYLISFLLTILLWRVTILRISNLTVIINDFIIFIIIIPILILIMIRMVGKLLVERIDFKVKAIVLKLIGDYHQGKFIWEIRKDLQLSEFFLLNSEYKTLILKKLPKILNDLSQENYIKGFDLLRLTLKGINLEQFYFRSDSKNNFDNHEVSNYKFIHKKKL